MKMDKDDLQVALNEARDNLKSLNEKIGRDQFRWAFSEFRVADILFTLVAFSFQGQPQTTALGQGQRQCSA